MFIPIKYTDALDTTHYFDQDDIRNVTISSLMHDKWRVEVTVIPNINIQEEFDDKQKATTRGEWWMQLAYGTKWANLRTLEAPTDVVGD